MEALDAAGYGVRLEKITAQYDAEVLHTGQLSTFQLLLAAI